MSSLNFFRKASLASAVFAAACMLPVAALAQNGNDSQTQAEVQQLLSGKHYANIHATVQNDVVTLNGQVDRLTDKVEAEKRVLKDHHVRSVDNQIVVNGPEISDAQLQAKLGRALIYDRVGYGTTAFNALTLEVHNGVATVGGLVVEPADKDSALALIENTAGVRGIVDRIQVAPPSPMDDRIRRDTARAIYGAPQLNKYALDPAKPIRIAVVNGHVTLVGMVDNKGDRDVAGMRANSVPGVFSVENDIQIQGAER